MNYVNLMYLHLWTIVPCFIIGTIMMFMEKGTRIHKTLGRIYLPLMLFTAIVTLFMQAKVGPRLFNHFGWIHSFSFITIYTVPTAYIAIRKGQVEKHRRKMILLYFGAILIAGFFAMTPGRFLYESLMKLSH